MKPAFVSTVLPLLLLMPVPQGRQHVVVSGRVTNASTASGIQAANVRSADGGVSVGTDSAGRYRLVLTESWRNREITLQVRAIGFAPQNRTVRLVADTTTVDFSLVADVNRLSEVIVTGVTGAAARTRAFAAAKSSGQPVQGLPGRYHPVDNTEAYDRIVDNPFLGARANPLSTFSADVDRASYSNVRRFVTMGQRPPTDAVRIEELVNYFTYDYAEPAGSHPFSVTTEVPKAEFVEQSTLVAECAGRTDERRCLLSQC